MQIIGDKVIFSTGTERNANCGIIGLSPELTVSEGYDGGFGHWLGSGKHNDLSRDEQIELADHMIAAWSKFKECAVERPAN